MKVYQKPAMLVLSISANDMLCSSGCTVQTRHNKEISLALEAYFNVPNSDGFFTREEAGEAFASSADSCTSMVEYQNYCKFNASQQGMQQLFTS